mmetsp:Transcript_41371/g.50319  ORF Transcript_41371/g.50319 Transcript_41371/m.50319 type:complete len:201 (+) Transcript_41371:315-917(+)
MLSMAKLSSILSPMSSQKTKDDEAIDDAFVLVRAMEMLGYSPNHNIEPAGVIFDKAISNIKDGKDVDSRVKAAMCGLAIAEILEVHDERFPRKGCEETAARVWFECVNNEKELWRTIVTNQHLYSDDAIKQKMIDTFFFRVLNEYVMNSTEFDTDGVKKNEDLSFLRNEEVTKFVLKRPGIEGDLKHLLKVAAGLVVESD